MRRLVLAVLCMAACAATAGAPRMDRSRLLIGAYSFGKAAHDEAHVRELKECGVDFVTGVQATDRETLDLLAKHGVGAILGGLLPGWWGGDGSNAGTMRARRPKGTYEAKLAEYVASLDHPAVWMLDLCDEPSALDLPYLGEICALVAARAPETPAYLNLYPNYASVSKNTGEETRNQLGTRTYREHIDVYCRTVPLDYISYDFYVYTPNAARRPSLYRQMYDNFNIVADACRRTGRSFWYIPQVNSHNARNFEPTTRNRLRFQAYTAMAFGAEAISWACWMPGWWTNNVLTAAGEKTAQYERLKTVNAELHRFGPRYMRFRSTATHYVGFAATNGLETLGVPLLRALDNGAFCGLRTLEDTPLVVGEMVPRGVDDGTRALFVVASGDPFDYAPARRTVSFRVPEGRAVEAFGALGPVEPTHEADGSFSIRLDECSAVLLTSRPAPCVRRDERRPAARHGDMAELPMKDGTKVKVPRPLRTEIVRVAAGTVKEMDVKEGAETPPLAFAGAGTVVKKGAGTLVVGPGDGSPGTPRFTLDGGTILVHGGRMPEFGTLRAGEEWRVAAQHPVKDPAAEAMAGVCVEKTMHAGTVLAKTGDGTLTASGVDGAVDRIAVMGGTLRLTPAAAGTDAGPGANLIADPGFERRGVWRRFVLEGDVTYSTQYSTPNFTYATDPWGFGYAMFEGDSCARLHNNGGAATTVDFPAPGRYRLTLHMRTRADDPVANPVAVHVKLAGGKRMEVLRMTPPFTKGFLEHSCVFDMPEAGPHELVITGLGVPSGRRDEKGRDTANRTTLVDGVTLARTDEQPPAVPAPAQTLPDSVEVAVAAGARLALDVPGTNVVRSLQLGGEMATGTVSAATHPVYISGPGVIAVRPAMRHAVRIDRTISRMDRTKLQIGVYCLAPYARTEAHVKDVKDCGVDFIYGVPANDRATLDLCAKHGLGAIATGAVPFWHGMGGEQAGQMRALRPMDGYESALKAYRDHPAVWLMDYIDEPSARDYPYIGEVTERLKAKAPKGVTPYINLYPNYASVVGNSARQARNQLGTATYREHVAEYSRCVGLDYVCFDFYLYSARGERRQPKLRKFYENFRDLAEMCRATGRSLWYIPQVNSSYPELWPSENMLRFQAYLAMAFGAEQIDWACWSRVAGGETPDMPGLTGWWTNNVLTLTGEKTEQYAKLRTVNAEIHRLGERYMKYRNVATYEGCGCAAVRSADGSHVTVGEMAVRDGAAGRTAYFVLASDDPFDEHPAEHRYEVRAAGAVRVTGKDGPLALEDMGGGVRAFTLRSNACALVETGL